MASLHHRVEGAGPALLLLHAGVADLRMWDAPVDTWRLTRTVVRCDLRGFGGSALTPGAPYGDAEDVLALLDELGITRFTLVGASYGGSVALQVASATPEAVERLVLLAPAAEVVQPDPSLRAVWEEEERLVDDGDIDAATELSVATWLGPDADDAARALVRTMQRAALVQQIAAGDVESRELPVVLEQVTMPTTVFVGSHDLPFFVATARELVRRLPHARLVELPWAGHLPTLERPAQMTGLVLEALGG